MSDRLRGYVGDEAFILNYEDEQSPSTIAYRAQSGGAAAPDPSGAFTYCDIGCGRAVTVTVLAAANPQARFFGVDPNPDHIREARHRADAAGLTNIAFTQAFIGEMGHGDLPPLDFATANGLYSCIDEEERGNLRRQAARYLKKDGLFQVSYNMAAGVIQMEPLRRFMKQIEAAAEGSPAERRARAVRTVAALAGENHPFFDMNPKAKAIVEDWAKRETALLTHTYFHDDWGLHDPGEIHALCEAAGLGFCGPWDIDLMPRADQARFAEPSGASRRVKEAIAAAMRADTYRTDVFRKGAPMTGEEPPCVEAEALFGPSTAPALLGDPRESGADPVVTYVLSAGGARYADILKAFDADGGERHVAARLGRAIRQGWLRRYAREPGAAAEGGAFRAATPLGRVLAEDPNFSDGAFLPSPVTGGGVYVSAMMLALLATGEGGAAGWPARALERVAALNKKKGARLGDRNAMAARLEDGVTRFKRDWAPLLTALGVAEPAG